MYAYSNNGLSCRAWNDPATLQTGEVFFTAPATPAQLTAAFAGYAAAAAALAAQKSYGTALAAGVQLISTATPALNGTYAIDAASLQTASSIALGIAARSRLPGGGSTFNYPDASGAMHSFAATDFLNFAAAIEDYVYALDQALAATVNGSPWSPPAQPVTIA